jgi:hypothetical protein
VGVRPELSVSFLGSLAFAACFGCEDASDAPLLSRGREPTRSVFRVGDYAPGRPEVEVVGGADKPIRRRSKDYARLVECDHAAIVFKDEERNGADRRMSRRTHERLHALAKLVDREWPGTRPRVTEAWDENIEHGEKSVHYEGRALDLTTSDMAPAKLGRLSALAREAGFDWVYFEDETHIHVSVR